MNKTHLKFGCLQFLLKRNNTKVQEKKIYNIHSRYSLDLVEWVVSLAAVFWMSRNAPPKERGGALRDIQKTATKETSGMGCFSYNRLSKNFRLSIASSVDSNQSNPSESLSSFWVSTTFLKEGSYFIARFHGRRRTFSACTGATFSESPFPSYSLINALSWISWRFSVSSKMRDQGSKFSVSSWEDSVPWLETPLSSLSSYFLAPCYSQTRSSVPVANKLINSLMAKWFRLLIH